MTAITVTAAVFCIAAVLVPGLAELVRVRRDRANPLRRLRVRTRRGQLPSASGSFVGCR
ncbi:MAG: hypothetical protein KC431_11865 [Myxococcales bacterium]|nr:hypothetical protein [Myxococcales bacterium]MCA9698213.1 hypothetical protein [Myxococcales bacterium]